jgi:hypothetical protein
MGYYIIFPTQIITLLWLAGKRQNLHKISERAIFLNVSLYPPFCCLIPHAKKYFSTISYLLYNGQRRR